MFAFKPVQHVYAHTVEYHSTYKGVHTIVKKRKYSPSWHLKEKIIIWDKLHILLCFYACQVL